MNFFLGTDKNGDYTRKLEICYKNLTWEKQRKRGGGYTCLVKWVLMFLNCIETFEWNIILCYLNCAICLLLLYSLLTKLPYFLMYDIPQNIIWTLFLKGRMKKKIFFRVGVE